jgi:hypothetical protein
VEHNVIDDLESRLRAARPGSARPDDGAFDAELLARVREQPVARRRTLPRGVAVPLAAGVTVTAAAVVMLAGGPGDVGGPSSASAITQTLRWLNPPPGSILHARSIETMGGRTTTREIWQTSDRRSERERFSGSENYETSGTALYDPATDTIYDAALPPLPDAKSKSGGDPTAGLPAGDPIVDKVRVLLREGHMEVTGREMHNGTEAWAISLKPDVGRPVWSLWVSAANGKPLELRDPGRDANEAAQVIRWPTYEVLRGAQAKRMLSLRAAHPSAAVVRDAAAGQRAEHRLMGGKR